MTGAYCHSLGFNARIGKTCIHRGATGTSNPKGTDA